MQGMMAQTVIVCNAEGELPQLLSEKVHGATELEIHGPISKEDVRAINKYPQVRVLDFTEADLSVIPDAAWDNLSLLQYVYLPKGIDTLYLNAISCEVDEVDIILPGKFPHSCIGASATACSSTPSYLRQRYSASAMFPLPPAQ